MISRRNFSIRIGGLVTTSFLGQRQNAFGQAGAPLLLEPKRPTRPCFFTRGLTESHGTWGAKYRITRGPIDDGCAPLVPTWREHLKSLGYALEVAYSQRRF